MAGGKDRVPATGDLLAAAADIIAAAAATGTTLRLLGGLAVFQLSEAARRPPLARRYQDFDLVVPPGQGQSAAAVFLARGYGDDAYFNAPHCAPPLRFTSAGG